MSAVASASASFGARLVDESRAGSRWQQLLVAVVGIVLAATLVIGQVAVATTHGLQVNLRRSLDNMRDGNVTVQSIVVKSRPTMEIRDVVVRQQQVLEEVLSSMQVLNGAMGEMGTTTKKLEGTVGSMKATSERLSSDVGSMDTRTGDIATSLGKVPGATSRTRTQLGRINRDSAAINTELRAIGGKLDSYGLPAAKGARR